jgi:hypothetical protein
MGRVINNMKTIIATFILMISTSLFASGDFESSVVLGSPSEGDCTEKALCFRSIVNGKSGEIMSVSCPPNKDGTCPATEKCIELEKKILVKRFSKDEVLKLN